jgi:sialidase-1
MWHPTPDVEWVYGEVTVEKSVPGSYFAAICFSCGYCGIQELYDGKKVAIFSVWDPGDPFDFKAKADGVDEKVRTKNLYAGEGVTISRFGGEGTGGKSLMPFDWKIGETYRFALHAKQDGDYRTAFSAYLFRDGAWFKIATFTTLQTKGAHAIKNVYSFVEDFRRNEESRSRVRRARFTNFFAKPLGGEWKAIEDGRFTADKNPIMTIDAEAVENGFALTTGGDTENINIKLLAGAKTTVGPRPEPCCALDALVPPVQVLFKSNDTVEGVKNAVYRIPALCTAPNGDLIAACDARRQNGGDLNVYQPINIAVRRSSDGGKTWTEPVNSWTWQWDDNEKWAGSDPSFVVDAEAKKIFLFYNVWKWEDVKNWDNNVYRFYVQESSDDGKTWSKPRDISADIAFPEWPFGKRRNAGGFIFISSGSGAQMKDGTLLHTLVHVNDGNALFGSDDHGKTWKSFGKPVRSGDECKVVELSDGSWMINSRWHGGGRQIHVSKDRGKTWESHYDTLLADPQCNAQIMRYGNALLFSNCKSPNRRALLYLRASVDDGKTWNYGLCIEPKGAAYSDMTILPNGDIGILYEGAGYATINFTTVPLSDVKGSFSAK